MQLFDRQAFEAFILSLPGTHIVHQWSNSSVGKIGPKIFAIHADWDGAEAAHIAFKCSALSFDLITELEGVRPARYLARAKWVEVKINAPLTDDELRLYLTEAHRLIAAKLPKAMQNELGLT